MTKYSKPIWRSKTIWGLVFMLAASMPGLNDSIWQELAAAGVPGEWVARIKVAVYLLGVIGVAVGRVTATERVTLT